MDWAKASPAVFYRELEIAGQDAKPGDEELTRWAWMARDYRVFYSDRRECYPIHEAARVAVPARNERGESFMAAAGIGARF